MSPPDNRYTEIKGGNEKYSSFFQDERSPVAHAARRYGRLERGNRRDYDGEKTRRDS